MRVRTLLLLLLTNISCLYNYDELRGGHTGAGGGGQAGNVGIAGAKGGSAGGKGSGGESGSGGNAGFAGSSGAAGGAGSAGVMGTSGASGTGGRVTTTGSGGSLAGSGGAAAGAGGKVGNGGSGGNAAGSGGSPTTGSGGSVAGSGGSTTGTGGSTVATGGMGGSAARGGSNGAGGSGGNGENTCPLGGTLNCSGSGALTLSPDGLVADFSTPEWDSSSGEWCDADGLRGSIFAYAAVSPSSATAAVDTTAQNLKLNLTVGVQGYAGGGLMFESCVNASAFTKVSFTATLTAGSMTGCNWQVQLETQEQRPSNVTNPSGGTCNPDAGTSCYAYPAVTGLAAPTATATTYSEPFTIFSPASSTANTRSQLVGIQWQLNSASGTGTCTAELRIDNITFQ